MQALADAVWKAARGLFVAVLPASAVTWLQRYKARHFRYERHGLVHRSTDRCIIDEVYDEKVYGDASLYRPGEVVIDVGGHIGAFASFAARQGSRVIVCEPAPPTLELLRRNVAGLPVSIHPVAVSDSVGEITLHLTENPAANTVFAADGEKVRVPLTTLDAVHQAEGSPAVDHLKIDVEGAELGVLRGGVKTLAKTKRVVMELHPTRIDPAEAVRLLEQAGFRVTVRGRMLEAVKVP